MSKFLKIFIPSLLVIAVVYGSIYFKHPIINKWLSGNARIIGKPFKAIVYTNGHINNDIKVYHDTVYDNGKTNCYLLSLKEFDKYGMLKIILIDLNEKWIGRPIGTSKTDYDSIDGSLFQSDVGSHFADFRDNMKGYNFDPHLTFTTKEIKFNIPPNQLKFDSIRIVLN